MIGPLLIAVSWILLRLEGRGIGAIGFNRPRRRFTELGVGFVAFAAAAAVQQLGLALAAGDRFVPNDAISTSALLNGLRFTANSVLYEELLFRGYLLYRAVRWLGPSRAVLLDAAVFGIYHWFSYGLFGNPVAMIYVFLLTGAFGYVWARAFVATGSVAAPIGMHLGWNASAYLIFSAGPLGPGLLVPASGARQLQVTGWWSLLLNVILPVSLTIGVVAYLRRVERRAGSGVPAETDRPLETE